MTGNAFFKVVIGVLALGLTYGAAFGGGAVYGRSTAPETAAVLETVALPTATATPLAAAQGQPPVLNFTADDVARFREQLTQQFGGQIPPALQGALDGFRDGGQLPLPDGAVLPPGGQGQFFFGGPGAQLGGGRSGGAGGTGGTGTGATGTPSAGGTGAGATQRAAGVEGKITSISDTKMTVETAQGAVDVNVDSTTPVQVTSSLSLNSLNVGDDVLIRGQRLADGTVRAVAISKQVSP